VLAAAIALAGCSGGGGREGGGKGPAQPGTSLQAPVQTKVDLLAPPVEGAGEVPEFRWNAVPRAAVYRLAVLGSDGDPIWAWEGTDTSVTLGGVPGERERGEGGPVIVEGSSWSVAAFDAKGAVVAVSVRRPVAP